MEKAPCKWVIDDTLTDLEQACICRDEAEHTATMAFSAHSLRVMLAQMDVARALLQLHALAATPEGKECLAQAAYNKDKEEVRVAVVRNFLARAKLERLVGNVFFAANIANIAVEENSYWTDASHPTYVAMVVAMEHVERVKAHMGSSQYGPALASLEEAIGAGARAKAMLYVRPARPAGLNRPIRQ